MRPGDLTSCDKEPIHIPGSIQPHGILLNVKLPAMTVAQGAGDIEGRLGIKDWLGSPVARLLGQHAVEAMVEAGKPMRGVMPPLAEESFDIAVHRYPDRLLVELEPAGSPQTTAELMPRLEAAAAAFEKASNLQALAGIAAREFRRLTCYDRVMIYRFLEDDAGTVIAEDVAEGQHSFLHHHFPASDIPAQARALYVRNLVRVIPDVSYTPAPMRAADTEGEPLDMSDCALRSVSPIHLQYLKNMGVGASASVSIVKDGMLWGLVACHHREPRDIPLDVRGACRALAAGLSRQIRAREDTDSYRERVRLRTFEDRIIDLLVRGGSLDGAVARHIGEVREMLDGDGVAVVRGGEIVCDGRCPPLADVKALAAWLTGRSDATVQATRALPEDAPVSARGRPLASGLLSMTLARSDPWMVIWFRSEEREVVNWAGNPHKQEATQGGVLTPRASFEAWSETVHGRSRRWTIPETEAAERLAGAVKNLWQTRRIQDLNKELMALVEQKETLARQREFLLGEVNHRVQNSLQLVSSFLGMQARETPDESAKGVIEEARRRIAAVSLVHRRLYTSEQIRTVDTARYVDELLDEMVASIGPEWATQLSRDLEPVLIANDRAISLGLILTELVINANKYAYDGRPGPLAVTISEHANTLRLTVADRGRGRGDARKGFGSRMLEAMVTQLGGTLEFHDNGPGTRAVLNVPMSGKT
ncbi:MAG: GAF domain-containing protein [Rhizobiaceae bacterium]|nr:GAF domain-containing protein [Rhizobiaceae bacterium]